MTVVFAWVRRLLTPQYRFGEPHPGLKVWAWVRTAGTILVAGIAVMLSTEPPNYENLYRHVLAAASSVWVNAGYATASVLLSMVILLAVARPGRRGRQAAALVRPLVTMLTTLAAFITYMAGTVILGVLAKENSDVAIRYGCIFLIVIIGMYLGPLFFWVAYLAARHWFNGADGHPLLPAMAGLIFAAMHAALAVYRIINDRLDPHLPSWFAIGVGLGGPAVTAGTALVEIGLFRRVGVHFRDLP